MERRFDTHALPYAPWRSVYKLPLLTESPPRLVLTSGGHNAGIVSPPVIRTAAIAWRRATPRVASTTPDTWVAKADLRDGSWRLEWIGICGSGIKEVSDKIWLVTFMHYDVGFFDRETCRLEPDANPFEPKVLPMPPV